MAVEKEAAAPVAVVEEIELTLTEFCTRLSESVRSPELIAGFEFTQKAAGNHKSTEAAYRARYEAFVNTPV